MNDWLKAGDDNTRFFHTCTFTRRRRNKIESLKNEERIWVEDKEELKDIALKFYTDLFSSNPKVEGFQRGFPTIGGRYQGAVGRDIHYGGS